jgi:hypothetical protein
MKRPPPFFFSFRFLAVLPVILLIIGWAGSLHCQTFQRTYGTSDTQTGTCIQNTLDGNYIVSAMVRGMGAGYNDFLLMKINTSGGLLWAKTYGGTGDDNAYFVTSCSDGGYILSGSTNSFGNGTDVYLVRTDSDGNLLWSKTIGGPYTDIGWFVLEMSDGSFYTCGQTNSFGGNTYDGYLIKNDPQGNLLWTKVFNGTHYDVFYGMSKTKDGGLIITGQIGTNSFGSSDIWLVRTDANGDTLWTSIYGKITEDAGWAVTETDDGGFAVTGDMHKDTITPGAHHTVLLKTNSAGYMQWAKLYGSNPGAEIGYDLRQTSDHGYTILGNTGYYGNGTKDILLFHTDSSGELEWANTFGSSMQDDSWQVRETADKGNIIIAATENFGANNYWDMYIVKTDSLGQDSCYEKNVSPEVFIPFLQQRRGFTYTSGGVIGNPPTIVNTVTPLVGDPCSFVVGTATADQNILQAEIYPNPFRESATLTISFLFSSASTYSFEVFDVFGKRVFYSGFTGDQFTLQRGDLNEGIYFYKLTSENSFSCSGKFTVQ